MSLHSLVACAKPDAIRATSSQITVEAKPTSMHFKLHEKGPINAKYLLFGLRSPAQFKSEVEVIDTKEEKYLVQGFDKETANAVLDFRSSLIDYQDRRALGCFLA